MYIDPRVAHALARRGLTELSSPAATQRKMSEAAGRIAQMPALRGANSRDLRRHLEKKAYPILDKYALLSCVKRTPTGVFLVAQDFAGNPEEGFKLVQLQIDCHNWVGGGVDLVTVRPHAIARLMQRTRTTDFKVVQPLLVNAAFRAVMLASVCRRDGWKQVGVPCAEGLFCGSVIGDGDSVDLATWFSPGFNGRQSRWEPYMTAIGEPMGDDGPALFEKAGFFKALIEWSDHLRSASLSTQYPFLLRAYAQKSDAMNGLWSAARGQAEAVDQEDDGEPADTDRRATSAGRATVTADLPVAA